MSSSEKNFGDFPRRNLELTGFYPGFLAKRGEGLYHKRKFEGVSAPPAVSIISLLFVGCAVLQGFALRGEFLFHVEKEPKDARGAAQDGHSVSIFAVPLEPPFRGTRTCEVEQNFRRAKSEWLV